jgi:ParB-like chromosome segregation protein Spo0J
MTIDYRNLAIHPLVADLFPPMTAAELEALTADIKLNGLKEPITLHEDKILDGNNRYKAFIKAGLEYKLKEECFCQFDPKIQGDPLTFVVSANLHRRHLNETQRATIAAKLVTMKLGNNQYTSSKVTNADAAKLLGVGVATVKMAKEVDAKAAPEIKTMVQAGKLRLGAAKQLLAKPKDQQVAELTRINAEREAAKAATKAANDAAKAGTSKSKATKTAKANQDMLALDEFKRKWQAFNDMQRKAFVISFKDELAEILAYVQAQEAMIGAKQQQAPVANAA